jgi:hypothetical protein
VRLLSPHGSPIHILEWSPLSYGLYLLSVDVSEKLCLWKNRGNIDDWVCVKEMNVEGVILAKWLSSEVKVSWFHDQQAKRVY